MLSTPDSGQVGELNPAQAAELAPEEQFQALSCAALATWPSGWFADDQQAVACDDEFRYRLDAAAATNADVATASAQPSADGRWNVQLTFASGGQGRWTELTRDASENTGGECQTVGSGGACQVAIVLDGAVVVAPEVIGVIQGPADITGDFGPDEARLLAAQLAHGPQPLVLDIESFES